MKSGSSEVDFTVVIVQKKLPAEFICGGFMKFLSDG